MCDHARILNTHNYVLRPENVDRRIHDCPTGHLPYRTADKLFSVTSPSASSLLSHIVSDNYNDLKSSPLDSACYGTGPKAVKILDFIATEHPQLLRKVNSFGFTPLHTVPLLREVIMVL